MTTRKRFLALFFLFLLSYSPVKAAALTEDEMREVITATNTLAKRENLRVHIAPLHIQTVDPRTLNLRSSPGKSYFSTIDLRVPSPTIDQAISQAEISPKPAAVTLQYDLVRDSILIDYDCGAPIGMDVVANAITNKLRVIVGNARAGLGGAGGSYFVTAHPKT